MTRFTKHLPHYTPLFALISAGLLGYLFFSYDKAFQFIIALAVSVSYVFWGIVHHKVHDDLTIFVVFEYLVIATLGMVIVFSLLFRA